MLGTPGVRAEIYADDARSAVVRWYA